MHVSKLALDKDPYYAQLLLDHSDALFLTEKTSIDSDVRVELWSQAAQDPVRLTRAAWRSL